ncbi:hypothetical protein [Nocardioides sp.]|uniref:hypothetical protein n=1 Tax=Nocardioides sp. TaxID=35761 RepID=UPI002D0986D8|nr:hypothetical protein [Nocardioides sp.]HXH77214.1 hypothetical protein [Nocardioides sp.]
MTGLLHPTDLRAWRTWHESRHPIRSTVRSLLGRGRGERPALDLVAPPAADILVCIEATHTSVRSAVASVLSHLPAERTAILCQPAWVLPSTYAQHTRNSVTAHDLVDRLPHLRAVLAAGHYTVVGAAGHDAAVAKGADFFISQHGALTPYAPPLPPESRLLAWSQGDADFWRSGRTDVHTFVTGSQLLWSAGNHRDTAPRVSTSGPRDRLTYLGQMHGAELSRSRLASAAAGFCRTHRATYRPHPSERDKLSQFTHAAYRRAGITVDAAAQLTDLDGPVVSVFSTGVLEAAAQGREAWVDFPRPPAWLVEFWERYDMHRFEDVPTPPPARHDEEPARRIARILMESVS